MTNIQFIIPFIRPYRRRLIIAFCGMIGVTLLSCLPPLITRFLIDDVVTAEAWHLLPWVALAICITPLLAHFSRVACMRLILSATVRAIADIRCALYRKILRLSLRYHSTTGSGMLVGRLMDDVAQLQQLLSSEILLIAMDLVVIIFALCVMFTISVPLTLGAIVMVACYAWARQIFGKDIRDAVSSYRYIFDRIGERLQETIHGVRQVRIFNQEQQESARFLDHANKGMNRGIESNLAQINLAITCQVISEAGAIAMMGCMIFMILDPDNPTTYGQWIAFMNFMYWMIGPVSRLTALSGQLVATSVSLNRIAELFAQDDEIKDPENPIVFDKVTGAVEIRDVHFAYTEDTPLYQGLSLSVPANTSVALVGATGCGKTTLTSILMRYWNLQEGSIEIDGINIAQASLASLRSLFGVVLQNPVIFDGTLAENIAYGHPNAARQEIEEAAKTAEVHELALTMRNGYDTVLGTKGVKLSMGERQRISIARAILRSPAILIMDEATSSMDSHSEMLIQRALHRILHQRTSFVVAHRLSTIMNSDMIVVMDAGAIVEKGTHDELLAIEDGVYRGLYDKLREEEQEDPS